MTLGFRAIADVDRHSNLSTLWATFKEVSCFVWETLGILALGLWTLLYAINPSKSSVCVPYGDNFIPLTLGTCDARVV